MGAMLLLKASLLLSATLVASRLLRRAPAATRHRLWTLAFAAILALPLLLIVVPALYVPMPAGRLTSRPYAVGALALPSTSDTHAARGAGARIHLDDSPGSSMARPESGPLSSPGFARLPARALLLTAWVAGALVAAAVLLVSLLRVRMLAGRAGDIGDADWETSAAALAARLGLKGGARLLVSPAVGTPMAGGIWRPAIYLPSSARGWSAEQRDVVLAHELAHLAGRDPLRHVAARLAVACYWFHPLAWIAARQAAAAREQACDEAVIALGTRPSDYARVLLELAESMQPSTAALAALPMIERSHLETRVMAILNEKVRVTARRGMLIPAAGAAVCTLVLASVQPAAQASPVSPAPVAITTSAPLALTPAAAAPAPAAVPGPSTRPEMIPFQFSGDSACASEWRRGSNFMGMTDTRVIAGRTVILKQVGTNGSDSIIQETFGDLRVCMVVQPAGPTTTGEKPSYWVGRAQRVVLEARRGNRTERLEIGPYGTGQRISWQVDGKDRGFDAAAEQWRDGMLAALDTIWEISTLHGEVSTLRGQISTIRGDESTLRGEISTLHGHISTLRGEQSTVRGEESTLRGEISSIRGHVSTLQGAISSEQGSISSLRAGGYRLDDSARAREALNRHENEIARLEREIRAYNADAKVAAVERDIARLDADKKVAEIETEIRNFDLNGKVAAIERQITALDVNGEIARLEREITALDVDRRVRELEKRRDDELKRLEAALAAIR
jgi:beta-lactamase regulating signal transducer with metallopeptidase domain/predicted  nucleic acid-binding Zn-ribbon protein